MTRITSPGRNGVTGDEAAISRIFSCSRVCTRNAARFCSVLRLRNRAVGVNADMPPPPLPKLGSFRAPASHGAIGGSIPRGAGVSLSPPCAPSSISRRATPSAPPRRRGSRASGRRDRARLHERPSAPRSVRNRRGRGHRLQPPRVNPLAPPTRDDPAIASAPRWDNRSDAVRAERRANMIDTALRDARRVRKLVDRPAGTPPLV